MNDAFDGRYGRIVDEPACKQLRIKLPDVIRKLSMHMEEVNLGTYAQLPPVVWIRLFRDAGVEPLDTAMHRFERWQKAQRGKGKVLLYQFRSDDGKLRGVKRQRDGLGKACGYSIDELLSEAKPKPKHWPYCLDWRLVTQRLKDRFAVAPIDIAVLPEVAQKAVHVKRKVGDDYTPAIKDMPKPRRKRRRTLQMVQRACGVRVVHALEECLAVEAARRKTVLEAGGRTGKSYGCLLSLDELVELLKGKFSKQLAYSESTLKSALSYFVSCPRGRPGGRVTP